MPWPGVHRGERKRKRADRMRLSSLSVDKPLPTSALASSGTPTADTFLRGDQAWAEPPGGGGGLPDPHTHPESDVVGLVSDLAAKCATNDARLSDARPPTPHTHAASDIASGVIATSRLGTGSPGAGNFLRGDGTWNAPVGGGSDTHGQTTVDFMTGADMATVTVNDAGVGASSRIVAQMAYAQTGGRDLDELEMDAFDCLAGNIVAGVSFDILAQCLTGYAHGQYLINYERN